jgi:hypothetical protein
VVGEGRPRPGVPAPVSLRAPSAWAGRLGRAGPEDLRPLPGSAGAVIARPTPLTGAPGELGTLAAGVTSATGAGERVRIAAASIPATMPAARTRPARRPRLVSLWTAARRGGRTSSPSSGSPAAPGGAAEASAGLSARLLVPIAARANHPSSSRSSVAAGRSGSTVRTPPSGCASISSSKKGSPLTLPYRVSGESRTDFSAQREREAGAARVRGAGLRLEPRGLQFACREHDRRAGPAAVNG